MVRAQNPRTSTPFEIYDQSAYCPVEGISSGDVLCSLVISGFVWAWRGIVALFLFDHHKYAASQKIALLSPSNTPNNTIERDVANIHTHLVNP
jgi:hypothetical protein